MRKDHIYDGTLCGIELVAIPTIEQVLKEFDPQLIVEFGTYQGGFTKYLTNWFPTISIYSVDLLWQITKSDAAYFRKMGNVSFLITQGVFRNELIIPLLLSCPLKKFFFCDNGKKKEEVMQYAGYLRPGDLLGIHDWGSEVFPEDIAHVLNEFDGHPMNEKLAEPGWSEARFFIRKQRLGRERLPNDWVE